MEGINRRFECCRHCDAVVDISRRIDKSEILRYHRCYSETAELNWYKTNCQDDQKYEKGSLW